MEKALRLAMFISLLAFAQWRVSLAWIPSTATFYGGADASETMGGACGYGNLYSAGYGVMTTALSTALFNNGGSCGACYQIKCDPSKSSLCKLGTSVTVTATNLCPPNYAYTIKNGGWCNPPNQHFDMAQPAWEIIGVYRAGIIPVFYQRVPCKRSGGIRFVINGNPYFELVTISNVGGSGIIVAVWIKGSKTDWLPMSRNWGMNWQCGGYLNGQILSFRIQLDNGKILIFYNIAPTNWWFGSTYSALLNF